MACVCVGPGYKSPLDAIKAAKETILYTVLVYCGGDEKDKPDALATIDADNESPTYSKILNILHMPYKGDELHHFGWNGAYKLSFYFYSNNYKIISF